MLPDRAIAFRPVAASDLRLLESWLALPHNLKWWGAPEEELGKIRDMLEGRDTTKPYIFTVSGDDIGYIQSWRIADYSDTDLAHDYPWLKALPADAVGIDLTIGDADKLSKGIGTAVLNAFVRDLLALGHKTIIIDPDPANARAIRAYEKTGFRIIPHLLGKSGDSLLMQYQLNETEPAT